MCVCVCVCVCVSVCVYVFFRRRSKERKYFKRNTSTRRFVFSKDSFIYFVLTYVCCILTSDPAGLSDEKCTSVNNRCIRSKISGDNLDCRQVELSVNCDARKKLMDIKLLYNPGNRQFRFLGEKMLEWEPCPNRGWVPRHPFQQPRRMERKAAVARRVQGSMCCCLCSVSNPPLTHNPFE